MALACYYDTVRIRLSQSSHQRVIEFSIWPKTCLWFLIPGTAQWQGGHSYWFVLICTACTGIVNVLRNVLQKGLFWWCTTKCTDIPFYSFSICYLFYQRYLYFQLMFSYSFNVKMIQNVGSHLVSIFWLWVRKIIF